MTPKWRLHFLLIFFNIRVDLQFRTFIETYFKQCDLHLFILLNYCDIVTKQKTN